MENAVLLIMGILFIVWMSLVLFCCFVLAYWAWKGAKEVIAWWNSEA